MSLGTPAHDQNKKNEDEKKAERRRVAAELTVILPYKWEPMSDGSGYVCNVLVTAEEAMAVRRTFDGLFFQAIETSEPIRGSDKMLMRIQHSLAKDCLKRYEGCVAEHKAMMEDGEGESAPAGHMTKSQRDITTGLEARTELKWIVRKNDKGHTEYCNMVPSMADAEELLSMYDGFFRSYVTVSEPNARGNVVLTISSSKAKDCLSALSLKLLVHQGAQEASHAARLAAQRDAATPASQARE